MRPRELLFGRDLYASGAHEVVHDLVAELRVVANSLATYILISLYDSTIL